MEHPPLEHPPTSFLQQSVRRVALACVQCRSRKVRCDATLPSCNRCLADMKSCKYQQSRRGGRPRQRAAAPARNMVEDAAASEQGHQVQWDNVSATANQALGSNSSDSGTAGRSSLSDSDTLIHVSNGVGITLGANYLTQAQVDHLLTKYYAFSTSHIRACSLDGRFCFGSPASQLHPIPYFQSCYTLVPSLPTRSTQVP